MKRAVKILLGLFGLTAVVVVAGVIALVVYIDAVAKTGVEQGASYALDVPTRLDSIHLGLVSGSIEMEGLNIANPGGFETAHFMDLGRGFVNVSWGSLRGDDVTLPELTLAKLDVNLERSKGKSNYTAILEGLKKFESDTPPPAEQSEGKKFIVKLIVVEDVTVHASVVPLVGDAVRVPIKIERIELADVGSDSGGVALSKLSGIIVAAVLEAIVNEAGAVLPDQLRQGLNAQLAQLDKLTETTTKVVGDITAEIHGQIKNLDTVGQNTLNAMTKGGDGLNEALKQGGEGLSSGAKGVSDGVGAGISSIGKGVEEGFGGLFGKKKKD